MHGHLKELPRKSIDYVAPDCRSNVFAFNVFQTMEDADNSDRKESLKQRSVCYFIMASVLGIVGAVFIVKGNAANSLLSQLILRMTLHQTAYA